MKGGFTKEDKENWERHLRVGELATKFAGTTTVRDQDDDDEEEEEGERVVIPKIVITDPEGAKVEETSPIGKEKNDVEDDRIPK